jgi:hypothetical protein
MKKKRYTKNWEVLVNPSWEDQVAREPLLAFSFVLSTRHNQLTTIADEILDNLDKGISKERIDTTYITKAGILIWLWTLGAYEIVRTMCQAKSCLDSECLYRLQPLKKRLAKVRMPDSKMEKQGKAIPVNSNRSPWCELIETQDLLIGDPDTPDSARQLLEDYFKTIDSIKLSEILAKHEESY